MLSFVTCTDNKRRRGSSRLNRSCNANEPCDNFLTYISVHTCTHKNIYTIHTRLRHIYKTTQQDTAIHISIHSVCLLSWKILWVHHKVPQLHKIKFVFLNSKCICIVTTGSLYISVCHDSQYVYWLKIFIVH